MLASIIQEFVEVRVNCPRTWLREKMFQINMSSRWDGLVFVIKQWLSLYPDLSMISQKGQLTCGDFPIIITINKQEDHTLALIRTYGIN